MIYSHQSICASLTQLPSASARSCTPPLSFSRTHIYLYGRARYRKIFQSSGSSPERESYRAFAFIHIRRLSHLKTQEQGARAHTPNIIGGLCILAKIRLCARRASSVDTRPPCFASGGGALTHVIREGSAAGCLPG
jgi:hypothetical protein